MPDAQKGQPGWEEWRSCKSKCRYVERPVPSAGLRVYRCKFCEGWHLTSKGVKKVETAPKEAAGRLVLRGGFWIER